MGMFEENYSPPGQAAGSGPKFGDHYETRPSADVADPPRPESRLGPTITDAEGKAQTWGHGTNLASAYLQGSGPRLMAAVQAIKAGQHPAEVFQQVFGGQVENPGTYGSPYDQAFTAYKAQRGKFEHDHPVASVVEDAVASAPLQSLVLGPIGAGVGKLAGTVKAGGTAMPWLGAGATAAANPAAAKAIQAGGVLAEGGVSGLIGSQLTDNNTATDVAGGMAANGLFRGVGVGLGALAKRYAEPVDALAAKLAEAGNALGVHPAGWQLSENPVMQKLGQHFAGTDKQTKDFTKAALKIVGEDGDRVTPDVLNAARTRIGKQFDDVAQGVELTHAPYRASPQDPWLGPGAALQTALDDMRSTAQHVGVPDSVSKALERQAVLFEQAATARGGKIPGDLYLQMTQHGSPLDKMLQSKVPEIRDAGSALRRALDESMADAVAGTDKAGMLAQARNQWRGLKVLEDVDPGTRTALGYVNPKEYNSAVVDHTRRYPYRQDDLTNLGTIGERWITPPTSVMHGKAMSMADALKLGVGGLGGEYVLSHVAPETAGTAVGLAAAGAGAYGLGKYAGSDFYRNALLRRDQPGLGGYGPANALNALFAGTSATPLATTAAGEYDQVAPEGARVRDLVGGRW